MDRCRLLGHFFFAALLFCLPQVVVGQANEAFIGRPFGVGRVQIRLKPGTHATELTLRSRKNRVFYPAFAGTTSSGTTGNGRTTIHFLFTGSEPIDLTIGGPSTTQLVVRPRRPIRRQMQRATNRWWRAYHAGLRTQLRQGDYPPVIQNYLASMLGYRLRLRPPLLSRISAEPRNEVQRTMELLSGAESLRDRIVSQTFSGARFGQKPTEPLPQPLPWISPFPPGGKLPFDPKSKEIEQIAWRVPAECFYVRFGDFNNFLWLDGLLNQYGGDITRMVTMRGHKRPYTQRFQQQLVLKQSALAKLLGSQVVADMALIGRDMFVREGAAMGVLFHARSSALFLNDIERQRQEAAKSFKGARLTKVKLAGRTVSFLSTPDNRLRSFLVSDGAFHLVTNSSSIAKRFLQTRSGASSLANLPEFQNTRRQFPLTRQDTLFAYFSSAFMHALVSPKYQIELMRRLQSVCDMEVARLTELVAKNEGLGGETFQQWSELGLLPPGFGQRPDGSGVILSDTGSLDSLRGARGYFTPIPDIQLTRVTAAEARQYAQVADYYKQHWRQMDPLVVAVRRFALNRTGLERIVIEANVSPLQEQKYGWITSILGPPTNVRIKPAPGDIVHFQAHVTGGKLSSIIPPHHIFAGIQDTAAKTDLSPTSFWKVVQIMQSTPGYLGGWPKPGFVDWLPLLNANRVDEEGYSRFLFGIWRRQWGQFSVLSFQRQVLEKVTPFIQPTRSKDAAQVRLFVGDITKSKLVGLVNTLAYQRSSQTSLGNIRLLNVLSQQLGVPRAKARIHAERILGTQLVCALGGKYVLGTDNRWQSSTKLDMRNFSSPLLEWFRGAEANLTKANGRMVLGARIDMQRKPADRSNQLPLFQFFGTKKAPRVSTRPADEKKAKRQREF